MTELLPFLTYCVLMSGSPGPNNLMLIASGAHHGYRRTLPTILGMNTGNAVQTFLTCMGLGAVFAAWPALHAALKIAGCLYMLWLAWRLAGAPALQDRPPQRLSFAHAALMQAVNPKSWVRAITIASVFLPAQLSLPAGALFVSVVGAVIGFPCVSMWALFGTALRRRLSDPRRRRVFNAIMGASLALLALLLMR